MSRITIKIQRNIKDQIDALKEELPLDGVPSVSKVIEYLINKLKEERDEKS